MFKDMCSEAHISGRKTNHSLRATGASELFEAGVPEKIIKERTAHRSLEALRLYERTTNKQLSAILSADKKTTYKDAIDQQKSVCNYQYPERTEFPVTAFPSSPMNWQQQSLQLSCYQYPVAATSIQPYISEHTTSIRCHFHGDFYQKKGTKVSVN